MKRTIAIVVALLVATAVLTAPTASSAAPARATSAMSAMSATSATSAATSACDSPMCLPGVNFLRSHACKQIGASASYHSVICGDIYERLTSSQGAFFFGRIEYVCARSTVILTCTGSKGLQYLYVSSSGWTPPERWSCGVFYGYVCTAHGRNYELNPTVTYAHPHPGNCWTLWFQARNVTFNNNGHIQKLAQWLGPKQAFCPKHN